MMNNSIKQVSIVCKTTSGSKAINLSTPFRRERDGSCSWEEAYDLSAPSAEVFSLFDLHVDSLGNERDVAIPSDEAEEKAVGY